MNTRLFLFATLFLLVSICVDSRAHEKSKVLIVTGQASRYHNWKVQNDAFRRILDQTGLFDVHVVTAPATGEDMSTFSPEWSDYVTVVLDYDGDEWSAGTKESFEAYMKNGGGLVVVHGSDNAFPKWKEYNEMIGLGGWGGRTEAWGPKVRWRDGRMVLDDSKGTAVHPSKHDFLVVTRAPEHPIMKGLPSAWLHANDELYSQLRGPAKGLTVLATASAATSMRNGTGENEPILMTIEYGKGRVFHTTLGHVGPKESTPVDSIRCAGFVATLQRGTEWVATGKVTQRVPDDFPTSDQASIRTELVKELEKPRVVVMTDGEIDDHSSMIRFLLYSCDVDLCAIIETNSMFQRHGHSKEDWYEKQLEAYGEVYANLIKHNPDYPSVEKLRALSFIGDEDIEHLKGARKIRWEFVPGAEIRFRPDDWNDTPGSDKIVEVLLEDNPAPVHIQAWGGGNTAARAFYKLKQQHPDDYKRAASKAVIYNIWYQDGAGNYIEQQHPEVTMIYCGSFAGTWNYRSQKKTYDLIEHHVKTGHGPLGALYPQDYVSEGDSPAFLYSIQNGLRNHEHPTFGGWGGRFEKVEGFDKVYRDAADGGDKKKSLRIWIDDANNDFQARMDWCVAEKFEDANHPPVLKISGDVDRNVKAGSRIAIDASETRDPDGDQLKYRWWQYKEAGSLDSPVELTGADTNRVTFVAPKVRSPGTIHVILEATDNGSPRLKSYQRVIVDVRP